MVRTAIVALVALSIGLLGGVFASQRSATDAPAPQADAQPNADEEAVADL